MAPPRDGDPHLWRIFDWTEPLLAALPPHGVRCSVAPDHAYGSRLRVDHDDGRALGWAVLEDAGYAPGYRVFRADANNPPRPLLAGTFEDATDAADALMAP